MPITGIGRRRSTLKRSTQTDVRMMLKITDSFQRNSVLAIVPKTIEFTDGRFVYRFLEHKPGEPMAAEPTVEKRVVVQFDPVANLISAVS